MSQDELFQNAVSVFGVRGLAAKLGVTPAYVSMIASGKRKMSQQTVNKLRRCGVNIPDTKLGLQIRSLGTLAVSRVGSTPIRSRHVCSPIIRPYLHLPDPAKRETNGGTVV